MIHFADLFSPQEVFMFSCFANNPIFDLFMENLSFYPETDSYSLPPDVFDTITAAGYLPMRSFPFEKA